MPVSPAASAPRARYSSGTPGASRAAAALDAPGVPLEYRARGAQAAGEIGTARTLYARMADDVFYYWYAPDYEPLGTWFQARRRAAALATTERTTN